MINCSDPGIILDIWSRDLTEGTCRDIKRGTTEPPTGRSVDIDRFVLRQTKRIQNPDTVLCLVMRTGLLVLMREVDVIFLLLNTVKH